MLTYAVVGALVLVVAALVAEHQITRRAPREAERRLTQWLGIPTAVVASGRPRDWLRSRTVQAVFLSADDVPIRDREASIRHLEVDLRGVRLEGRGADRRIVADSGSFRAVLDEASVRRLVDLPPLVRRLDLRHDRVRLVTSAGINLDVRLHAERGAILLQAVGNPFDAVLPLRHRIPLDDLPAGARIERVTVRGGALLVTGPIDGDRLAGG